MSLAEADHAKQMFLKMFQDCCLVLKIIIKESWVWHGNFSSSQIHQLKYNAKNHKALSYVWVICEAILKLIKLIKWHCHLDYFMISPYMN